MVASEELQRAEVGAIHRLAAAVGREVVKASFEYAEAGDYP